MKYFGMLALLLGIFSCSSDHIESFAPGATVLTLDLGERIVTFDSIAGATTYNLYYKQVEDCEDVETAEFQTPTKDDTKIENVISPFSIEDYKGCTTCFYAAVAAENEVGEGNLSNAVGWQLRNCI